ncbi:MAG: CapA family protein [Acidimicrobiia bacterium]
MRRKGWIAIGWFGALGALAALAACSRGVTAADSAEPAVVAPPPTTVAKGAVTFAFAGDIHTAGGLKDKLLADPNTWLAPVAPVLQSADIAVVNLETAVTNGGTAAQKEYSFRAPPEVFAGLAAAGVDAATVANNHGLDYGQSGFNDTLAAAQAAKFPLLGAGANEAAAYAPWIVTVNNRRVAIFAASQVIPNDLYESWIAKPNQPGIAAGYDADRLGREIAKVRASVDTVVVYLHWGEEQKKCATDRQKTTAKKLVDAGADIVVGSHAHRIQGAGKIGSSVVAYGLGNFVWYNEAGDSGQSGVLMVTAEGRTITDYHWVPARIRGGIPVPLTGESAATTLTTYAALRQCSGLAA